MLLRSGNLPAALGEVHETTPAPVHRRVLVVRGTRLDVLCEQRTPEPSRGARLSEALDAICQSLQVPTNHFLPYLADQDEVYQALNDAQQAVQQAAWDKSIEPALRARRAAQSTYLHSLLINRPFPEIPAIMAVIGSLMLIAQAGGALLPLRDAEHLTLRALYTLRHLPLVPRKQQIGASLAERLEAIRQLQIAIVRLDQPAESHRTNPKPGFGLALLRLDPLLAITNAAAKRGHDELALWQCEAAIADSLIVLTTVEQMDGFLHGQAVDSKLITKLTAAGAKSSNEQEALIRQINRRLHLQTLQDALTILTRLRAVTGNEVGAAEASHLLLKIAQELSQSERTINGAEIRPAQAQPLQEASALIGHAVNLANLEDVSSLEDAHKILDRAEKLLDTANEEGALRTWLCLVRASVLHSQRHLEGALAIIERGLQAAANEPEITAPHLRELKTIQSQFLLNAGETTQALQVAQAALALADAGPPPDARSQANYYLNLATIEMRMTQMDAASEHLRQGLRRILAAAPFGEEALRLLMVAARLYAERAPQLSYRLNLAAAANLDARRTRLRADQYRLDFDEATRRREVYEDLVARLVALDMGREAVEAADRSRARALNELLIAPRWEADPAQPLVDEAVPALDSDDMRQGLAEGAEYIIRSADKVLRQQGATPPLRADNVESIAQAIGTPTLIIQPVRHQVALILILPSGQVITKLSPLPRQHLLDLVSAVQQSLHIWDVPRGDTAVSSPALQLPELYRTLEVLWDGLLGPVAGYLTTGEPLVLVPYREFTLTPFALLRDRQKRWLIDNHALLMVPSLATLCILRERGVKQGTLPSHVYVAGDPAVHARYLLERLPAARIEAQTVVQHLLKVGIPADGIKLRLDKQAHKLSYQREAHGSDLVHLSCHAALAEPAYTSRLYFAPQETDDGLLLASEIADIGLNDALVFLSACETGQGRATADGVVGLGRAFLEAGARAVILSLWKVEDSATALLSDQFYRALLQGNKKPNAAEALRTAMLEVRADLEAGRVIAGNGKPLDAHPAYWAPFVILGDALSVSYGPDEQARGGSSDTEHMAVG